MSTETFEWLQRPPPTPIGRDFMTDAIARVRTAATGRPHSPLNLSPIAGSTLYDEWLAYAEKAALSHAPSSSRSPSITNMSARPQSRTARKNRLNAKSTAYPPHA